METLSDNVDDCLVIWVISIVQYAHVHHLQIAFSSVFYSLAVFFALHVELVFEIFECEQFLIEVDCLISVICLLEEEVSPRLEYPIAVAMVDSEWNLTHWDICLTQNLVERIEAISVVSSTK